MEFEEPGDVVIPDEVLLDFDNTTTTATTTTTTRYDMRAHHPHQRSADIFEHPLRVRKRSTQIDLGTDYMYVYSCRMTPANATIVVFVIIIFRSLRSKPI